MRKMAQAPKIDKSWLNVKEAAEYLGISRKTIYRLIESGQLRYFEIQGVRSKKFKQEDLDALFREVKPKK